MLKKNRKFLSLIVVGIMLMFLQINSVSAAVVTLGERLYYHTTKDSNFGVYYGTSSATGATRSTSYKSLDGVEAYCVQADTYSPKNGVEYVEVSWGEAVAGRTWNSIQASIAGILMTIADANYSGNEAYVYKYAMLNSYLGFNKSENFSAYNTKITEYISEAVDIYNESAPTSPLPSFGATATKNVMDVYNSNSGQTYYVGSFTLSNLVSTFGGASVSYTITVPSDVKLYTDSSLTKEADLTYNGNLSGSKTFYVKYTGSDVGGQVQIKISGYNSNTYSVARLWRTVDTSTNYQMLVTYDTRQYNRSRSRTVTFDVPDVTQKTIKIVKKDAGTGENLKGSTLKLQLSGGSTNSCTVQNGNYSCSISIAEDLTSDTYYSVVETVAPDGYVLGDIIENIKWDINSSGKVCYASSDSGLVETEIDDCNRNYQVNTVCTTEDGVTKEGACETIVDPSLPEDTPEEDKTYITVGTEEKVCYYLEGDNVIKVDESKCNTQYIKVTNSSGNLVVEYYNTKNHIEISKYTINGDKELVGAELKICSTKPNANGECTIVRNTLEGQCISNGTTEGELNLTNEYNCSNNDDGTKTVDMHWISGLSSKIWYGIPAGTYYIVETVAPSGYLPVSTYVEFTVDANGNVTSTEYDEETKKIIVRNKPTSFKVIKQDEASGKKLEGATLSICSAFKDADGVYHLDVGADGYCFPAILSSGEAATWVTTDKTKVISGLGVGTYYLVELVAPENYSIADSILFTVNADGTITDKDGNPITDNELIMKDVAIVNQKTGDLPILTILLVGVGAVVVCGLSYYYLVKKNGLEIIKNKFKKNK